VGFAHASWASIAAALLETQVERGDFAKVFKGELEHTGVFGLELEVVISEADVSRLDVDDKGDSHDNEPVDVDALYTPGKLLFLLCLSIASFAITVYSIQILTPIEAPGHHADTNSCCRSKYNLASMTDDSMVEHDELVTWSSVEWQSNLSPHHLGSESSDELVEADLTEELNVAAENQSRNVNATIEAFLNLPGSARGLQGPQHLSTEHYVAERSISMDAVEVLRPALNQDSSISPRITSDKSTPLATKQKRSKSVTFADHVKVELL